MALDLWFCCVCLCLSVCNTHPKEAGHRRHCVGPMMPIDRAGQIRCHTHTHTHTHIHTHTHTHSGRSVKGITKERARVKANVRELMCVCLHDNFWSGCGVGGEVEGGTGEGVGEEGEGGEVERSGRGPRGARA